MEVNNLIKKINQFALTKRLIIETDRQLNEESNKSIKFIITKRHKIHNNNG